ncbi:MAG TPA: hypothetical protein VEI02_03615, partial [Planctomycetota bacterium]|nr:hypothetical protein [Planctomycetota bacterium]
RGLRSCETARWTPPETSGAARCTRCRFRAKAWEVAALVVALGNVAIAADGIAASRLTAAALAAARWVIVAWVILRRARAVLDGGTRWPRAFIYRAAALTIWALAFSRAVVVAEERTPPTPRYDGGWLLNVAWWALIAALMIRVPCVVQRASRHDPGGLVGATPTELPAGAEPA